MVVQDGGDKGGEVKTEKEWLLEVEHRVDGLWESDVRGIQADALRHAAKVFSDASTRLCGILAIEDEATDLEGK